MSKSTMLNAVIFVSVVVPVVMFQPLAMVPRFRKGERFDKIAMLRRTPFESLVSSESSTQLHSHTQNIPKLIVFDLDNTIWAPELFQFRKQLHQQRQAQLQPTRYTFGKRLRISNETSDIGGDNSTASSTFVPKAYKDVKLTRGFQELLKYNILQQVKDEYNIKLAIASRSKSVDWAHSLLDQFEIRSLFDYIEIYPGSKVTHFQNLQKASGFEYNEMLFFDDTRDGQFGNCVPISQLGVLSVHCPRGLNNIGVFTMGINKYKEEWINRSVNSIVEYDGTITKLLGNTTDTGFNATAVRGRHGRIKIEEGRIYSGVVRKVDPYKKYGFIRYRNSRMRDVFFHYSSFANSQALGDSQHQPKENEEKLVHRPPLTVQEGDKVSFEIQYDPTKNDTKIMASNISIVQRAACDERGHEAAGSSETQSATRLVPMRCVSMNQPFASLVANGYKTLESRNGTMFTMYPKGTQLLLHVTKHSTKSSYSRNYPLDPNQSHLDIMKSSSSNDDDDGSSLTDEEIEKLKQLPQGYGKGDIVAIIEIGKTYEMSIEERSSPSIQRQIVLSPEDSGKYVTEIKHASYLKKPIKNIPGQPGIFKVQIDPNVIPTSSSGSSPGNQPEWIVPSSKTKEELLTELCDII